MAGNETSSSDGGPRVVNFPRTRSGASRTPPPAVDDLAKFEQEQGVDDYRHRMIVNIVALVFVAALIGVGYWLADTMATMRKNQDCVLSGRRGCAPVEVTKPR